jgi:hypothetical protein
LPCKSVMSDTLDSGHRKFARAPKPEVQILDTRIHRI